MVRPKITTLKGKKPILIYSIHDCSDWNEWGTREINEELHQNKRFYSFIYSGPKARCLRDTKNPTYSLIDEMLTKYQKIGLISLHRRSNRAKIKKSKRNLFELGTLRNQSLDIRIKKAFKQLLAEQGVMFDDNQHFTGGESIWRIHKRYNDPSYVPTKTSSYNPSENQIQIAQFEINGLPKPDTSTHYKCVLLLAQCMQNYFK